MLERSHLGNEIGRLDQSLGCVAAGDETCTRPARLQRVYDFFDREIVVAQHHIELVKNDQVIAFIRHHLGCGVPRSARGGDVAGAVLCFPSEPLAHNAVIDQIFKSLESELFPGAPGALDELHQTHAQAVASCAEHKAEGRGGFPLPRPGVDHDETLLDRLACDQSVLEGLTFLHLLGMALVVRRFIAGHETLAIAWKKVPETLPRRVPRSPIGRPAESVIRERRIVAGAKHFRVVEFMPADASAAGPSGPPAFSTALRYPKCRFLLIEGCRDAEQARHCVACPLRIS